RTENIDSPGALLWRQFANALEKIDPDGEALSTVPFDVKRPMVTPSGLKALDPRVRKALDEAIGELELAKIPLDATLRNYQYAVKGNDHIPISGGEAPGQYNLVYNDWVSGKGYPPIVGGPTFIMWMQFTPKGPVGESVLAFSQSPNSASPLYADQTRMWSEMRTKKMRFSEADILADPNLKTIEICSRGTC
ncbi:MAG: acylase, partial [Rhizobiaceae bacterium]